jgi:hypothetical protein
MMTIKPPEPKDTDRVTFRYEADDITIAELKERARLANEAMNAAIDGYGKTHTMEEVEAAVRTRAEAGTLLELAKVHVSAAGLAEKMLRQFRETMAQIERDPLSVFRHGRG